MKIKDIKYHYDISNAEKDLGYKPKFFHIEMLKDMKEEMKKKRFDFLND
jgi:nucleoside-diphosphate-sugar epimerase